MVVCMTRNSLLPPPVPVSLYRGKELTLGMDVQQTVLNLIEKQPVVSPDMLEAIAAPAPTMTPEQNLERIEKLKNRVMPVPSPNISSHHYTPLTTTTPLSPLPSPPATPAPHQQMTCNTTPCTLCEPKS